MATASEDWIQQSLARLEQLEQQREQHESALETVADPGALRRHSEAIERLDAEIRSLYEALEAVAGDEGATPAESASDTVSTSEFQRTAESELDDYDPFGTPAGSGSAPVQEGYSTAAVPAFGAAPAFDTAPGSYESTYEADDSSGGGGAMKWVLVAAVVLGVGGAGGYFVMSKKPTEAPAAAQPQAPAQVISSSSVPPDTQGPKVAQGADAAVTPGTKYQKSRGGGGGGGGGGSRPRAQNDGPSNQGHGVTVENSRDPLAGLK